MTSTDDILKKYGAKIESQMGGYDASSGETKKFGRSYEKFKGAMLPEFSRYERWCKSMGNVFKMKVGRRIRLRLIGILRLRIWILRLRRLLFLLRCFCF